MTFRPGGSYDMKKNELLGNSYFYKIFVSGKVLSEQYSGEQIGNMMYGYASAAKGYSYYDAVKNAEQITEGEDSLEDKFSILMGYTYRKNGHGTGRFPANMREKPWQSNPSKSINMSHQIPIRT